MKKQIYAVIIILTLASFACSFQNYRMETIDAQWVNVNEALPKDVESVELVFRMTGGKFLLTPGSEGLVNGHIAYNIQQWEPEFIRRDQYLEIKQSNPWRVTGLPTSDVENNWELAITETLPLSITIEGGASENDFDLTGLQLTDLRIVQGASDTKIRFDTPNPQTIERFIFTTGASSAKLTGLGNANFKQMTMSGGAGDYTLDFNGTFQQDAVVDIKTGISNITIILPAELKAIVNNNGTVTNINTRGTWLVTDNTYTTLSEGFTLTINLDMAVGNVTLVHDE